MRVLRDRNPMLNPSLFGVELSDALWGAGGAFASGHVNDKVIAPFTDQFASGIRNANNTIGQLWDSVTTFAAAWGVGEVVSRLASRRAGQMAALGGAFYAGGKAIAALVPGASMSARFPFPEWISVPRALGSGSAAAGGGSANGLPSASGAQIRKGL